MTRRLVLAGLCGGYFLILLDVTVVTVVVPGIGADLGSAGLPWVVDGYTIPLAALLLAAGVLGDRVGHRRVVLAGLVVFGAASAVAGSAPTMTVLALARAAQGAGAALLLPGTLALVSVQFNEPTARTRAVGVWAAVGGLALPAGPLLGGLVATTIGWRAVFWINVPAVALVAVAIVAAHEPTGAKRAPIRSLIRPGRASGTRTRLAVAAGLAGVMNAGVVGMLFLLTQDLQTRSGLNPFQAGLALLPAMAPMPLIASAAGRLAARRGTWRVTACGFAISAVGLAAVVLVQPGLSVASIAALTVWGIGIAFLTPAIVSAAMEQSPDAPGLASGLSNTARQLGITVGVPVLAAVAGPATGATFADRFRSAGTIVVVVFVLCAAGAVAIARKRSGSDQPLLIE